MSTEFHIGIDDTDSPRGGCTTYTATLLFEELCNRGLTPLDYPWLVRLNPNIPWKTRGNGALSLHFHVGDERLEEVKRLALETVLKNTDSSMPSTDPAVVFLRGKIPPLLTDFSRRATCDVIRIDEARFAATEVGAETHLLKGSRGLVGALAAVGADLPNNHTFEIICYRGKNNLGKPRELDLESVREMNSRFGGRTFNNLDPETGRILISPHGPDPVLFGIRGEDPRTVWDAFRCIRAGEPIERVMVFKTNHGTDAHLEMLKNIKDLETFQSAVVLGKVTSAPKTLKGGHVIFQLCDETGLVDCAAYEPTGRFRNVVRQLIYGDAVKVGGGVRREPGRRVTLNLERLEIISLTENAHFENPTCIKCNKRCESMGRGQGYRCRVCSLRYPRQAAKVIVSERKFKPGVYVPPPRANRHLTMPATRHESREYSLRTPNGRFDDGLVLSNIRSSTIRENN